MSETGPAPTPIKPFHDANGITLYLADCVEAMRAMPPNSVDAIVCDPPYGLEFMSMEWDRLEVQRDDSDDEDGDPGDAAPDAPQDGGNWQAGGGFSKPGIGDRAIPWPSFSATSRFGAANPTCAVCGGRLRGAKKCTCDQPHEHWKPIGKRRNPENEGLPDDMTGGGMAAHMSQMQGWHLRWAVEAIRALKPGGHLLSFGGTRTYHRLACAIEDAGFEIRDCVMCYTYFSGFPKSLDVARVMRKAAGGNPDDADRWAGWGTQIKPSQEPIVVARKPMSEGSVVANVRRWGVGALNLGACRVGNERRVDSAQRVSGPYTSERTWSVSATPAKDGEKEYVGRWTANSLFVHSPLCQKVGKKAVPSDGHYPASRGPGGISTTGHAGQDDLREISLHEEVVDDWRCAPGCPVAELIAQAGPSSASVFNTFEADSDLPFPLIYSPKANRGEREAGLEAMGVGERETPMAGRGQPGLKCRKCGRWKVSGNPCACPEPDFEQSAFERPEVKNIHPTAKPVGLMRHLVRLACPPGGVVLDCFMGSGSTGVACVHEGFRFIGIEKQAEYIEIARRRIAAAIPGGGVKEAAEIVEDDGSKSVGRQQLL